MSLTIDYEVSVVLALNKIDDYTNSAIDSVINQRDIVHEIIIVVNGPDHSSLYDEINSLYGGVDNVTIIGTPIPQLSYALNLGVSQSNSDFIARMDADDIAVPSRLAKQLDYIKKNNLDMVGSDIILIDEQSRTIGYKSAPRSMFINRHFMKGNPFFHPSVMYSKKIFYKSRGYNAGFNSEDYDLWLRFYRHNPKWDNIAEPLLKYRVHTATSQGSFLAYCEVSGYYLREFFLNPSFVIFVGGLTSALKAIFKSVFKK